MFTRFVFCESDMFLFNWKPNYNNKDSLFLKISDENKNVEKIWLENLSLWENPVESKC